MSTTPSTKIKILFLGANPSDTTRLALGNEVREIEHRLRGAPQSELFDFVQEWAVRVGDLQKALLRHRPQIVHFSGHGRGDGDPFSRSVPISESSREMLLDEEPSIDVGDGQILVEDDVTREAKPIPAQALGNLFQIVGGVRYVVLNACHSVSQAEAICTHVEAVIGMRRSIQDHAAIKFSSAFYQGLAFGETLSNAFKLGQNEIELHGYRDHEVPQLITRDTLPISHPKYVVGSDPPPSIQITDRPSWNSIENAIMGGEPPPSRPIKDRPSWPSIDVDYEGRLADPFLLRVERIAKLRVPESRFKRKPAKPPYAGVLEIEVDAGGFYRLSIVAGLNQALTEELATQFIAEIDGPARIKHPFMRSTLVHQGQVAPLELRARFDRMGIDLQTFDQYQGLFDLQPYIEWQKRELDKNPAYSASTYVDPPAWIKVAGTRELAHTPNALTTVSELLLAPQHRRFLLVLGEFGAGKTFLLRELCRQMVQSNHPVIPVLLEMSKLEKQHSLAELLGAHFARADVPGYSFKAFDYMLREGRIALFFDGFDELADKVTYDSATLHLDTVLSATYGQAKVVLSSRRQHFLTEGDVHKAVEREFARRAESAVQGGYRLLMLQPFGEKQIKDYLHNRLLDEKAAEDRFRLLDEVKDLLGLSHNPRMLSFIAEIPEESLREAKQQWGEITAAQLYKILVDNWLDVEHVRSKRQGSTMRVSRLGLLRGVESLAVSLWHSRSQTMLVSEISDRIAHALTNLGEPPLEPSILTHVFGSGSLLVRDDEGRFSFVHRSVLEWLVAQHAANELLSGHNPSALMVDEMSALMADFFAAMAGRERTAKWAREILMPSTLTDEVILQKNAALLLTRMGERFERANFEGQDLRGKDFSGVDWRSANLRGSDLRGVILRGADLRGASLVNANLSHADLRGANLTGVDLEDADLSFVRAEGACFAEIKALNPQCFRGANLLRAKGIASESFSALRAIGAVVPDLKSIQPMAASRSSCRTIAWSPQGSIFATGHDDGTVRICEVATGNAIRLLSKHTAPVRCVAFSPDGRWIASGSDDKSIEIWDVATGNALRSLIGHVGEVRGIAISPDGATIVSGSEDTTLRLWNVKTAECIRIFEGHALGIRAVAFSPNGKHIASGSRDGAIGIWDVTKSPVLRFLQMLSSTVYSLAFAPDGITLAAGSAGARIRLWNARTGRCLHTYRGHSGAVYTLVFSPDGKWLVSGSEDRSVRSWDTTANAEVGVKAHASSVFGVALSPGATMIASAMDDGCVDIWNVGTTHATRCMTGFRSAVRSVMFSPNGKTLAIGSSNNYVQLWDVTTGMALPPFKNIASNTRRVVFSPDGETLAAATDGTIWIWRVETGAIVRGLDTYAQEVYYVEFSPDGKTLAVASNGSIVKLWDVDSGFVRHALDAHIAAVYSIAFSPNSKFLVSGSDDATIRIWDAGTGKVYRTIEGLASANLCVAFSPDGEFVAAGSYRSHVQLWNIHTGKKHRDYVGHRGAVRGVVFSPDGAYLATASYDNTIRLWNVATGQTVRIFEGHTSSVLSVAFSPDGKTIASGSSDNTVRLWGVASGQCHAIFLATPEGWVAFTPDGRYKYGGNITGSFWHVAGLCRFEPGELDEYLNLRLPDDARFLPAKP